MTQIVYDLCRFNYEKNSKEKFLQINQRLSAKSASSAFY